MIFNSYTFVVFLAFVLAVRYSRRSWKTKKIVLLLASYLFYAAWNPPFVLLLWGSTIVDWFIARRLFASKEAGRRKLLLFASLGVNLGLLAYFKYGDFALRTVSTVVSWMGGTYEPAALDIILPVGISFYTFQTLSYTIDVYRGDLEPWDDFTDYALYVTFFPQLVAGPIVRASDFLPQCREPTPIRSSAVGWGLALLALGLFEKVVLADTLLAPVADALYLEPATPGFYDAWVGTLAFAGQIFCDFAGYSLCAIGVAMCLGFSIIDNFRFPYAAIGFSDFWRRWHISLSTWLRDYLYIPLGGNRVSLPRTYVNLMLTMLIGGLWHGAGWTFVVWGGLHGSYLAIERAMRTYLGRLGKIRALLPLAGLGTFVAVCFAWVFFRATEFSGAMEICKGMLGAHGGFSWDVTQLEDVSRGRAMVVMAGLIGMHWLLRNTTLEDAASRVPWWGRSVAIAFLLGALFVTKEEGRAFIYFQF
jgi:D-alanyl-lipoteichoic acid acyltransferase DltB (MBOAT superfamily)